MIDIDAESRHLTLRVIGRSMFGLDLDADADRLAVPARDLLAYTTARGLSPAPVAALGPDTRAAPVAAGPRCHLVDPRRRHGLGPCAPRPVRAARSPPRGDRSRHRPPPDPRGDPKRAATFLLAGHDTTATTLTYALWQLGRDPGLQSAVATEALALGRRDLTMADVAALPLTVRVLHEALRLCPPGAAIARSVEHDIAVDGCRVEAGDEVLVGIWALHRDPAIWGPGAEEFDPDRFLPERSAGRDRWAYLPFGGGNRSCIGDHFAMTEACIALATLVREVEFVSQDDTFEIALPFTLTAAGAVPVRVRSRRPAVAVQGGQA